MLRTLYNPSLGLLLLRLGLGAVFIVHGAQKLFGGIPGTTGFFASLGIPAPGVTAWVVGTVEFVGGIMIVIGLLTPLAAMLVAAVMLVAIVRVHLPQGFMVSDGGYEFAMMNLAAALALVFAGPGRFSVDGLLAERRGVAGDFARGDPATRERVVL